MSINVTQITVKLPIFPAMLISINIYVIEIKGLVT